MTRVLKSMCLRLAIFSLSLFLVAAQCLPVLAAHRASSSSHRRESKSAAAGKDSTPAKSEVVIRIIDFPPSRTVGTLYIGKINALGFFEPSSKGKPARGKVQVPASGDTLLEVNFEGSNDLSFILALKPNELSALSFANNGRGLSLEDASLRNLDQLTGLRLLNIESTEAGNQTLKVIEHLSNLESLNISGTNVTAKGLSSLSKLTKLRLLAANRTRLSDKALESVKDLVQMRTLELRQTGVTSAGMKSLGKLTHLNTLLLANNKIEDAGLQALPVLTELHTLDIDNCGVTEAGAIYLNNFPNLARLYAANLQLTPVTFKQLTRLKKLTNLAVTGTAVKPEALKGLETAHWQIKLSASPNDAAAIKKMLFESQVEIAPRAPLELFRPFN